MFGYCNWQTAFFAVCLFNICPVHVGLPLWLLQCVAMCGRYPHIIISVLWCLCVCHVFNLSSFPRCPDGYFGPRCLQTEPLRLRGSKSMLTCDAQPQTEAWLSLGYHCCLCFYLPLPPRDSPASVCPESDTVVLQWTLCFCCPLMCWGSNFMFPLLSFSLPPLFSFFAFLLSSLSLVFSLSIRCPNDFTGDRCQTYVMASFYRMSFSFCLSVCLLCMRFWRLLFCYVMEWSVMIQSASCSNKLIRFIRDICVIHPIALWLMVDLILEAMWSLTSWVMHVCRYDCM